MKLCVIIGFNYGNTLSASSVDMFIVYDFFSIRGFKCIVMSDVTEHPSNVMQRMFDDKVRDNIYSFLPTIPMGRHPLPNLTYNIINDVSSFVDNINKLDLMEVECLVIYYTGHCEPGSMITLPDGNYISARSLIESVINKCNNEVEILVIFDCCNAGNILLPYSFIKDQFLFTSSLSSMDEFVDVRVTYLSSSYNNQTSLSNEDRSYFTKYLIRALSQSTIKIKDLIREIQASIDDRLDIGKQTVSVYSSYKQPPLLYSWLLPTGLRISIKDDVISIIF